MNRLAQRMHDPDRVLHEELLHAAATAGDARAWQALYDRSYDGLARYVRWRLGGRSAAADEVIQDTWLTAVRLLDRFEPRRGAFVQWLRGIAANALRNYVRRERFRSGTVQSQSVAAQTAAETAAGRAAAQSHTALAATVADESDRAPRIAAALAALPEHYEEVLRLKYVDGLSVAQVAAARNQTVKAAESLLSRAREAFRAAYDAAAP